MPHSFLHRAASAVADGLAIVAGLLRRGVAPVLRLARLAALRSRLCAGMVPVSTQFDGPVRANGRLHLRLGEHCRVGANVFFETCEGGRIVLGDRVRINLGSVLVSYAQITIGSDCLIGEYVSIRDADHGLRPGTPIRTQAHTAAPVHIGDDVWIARGAVILKGVTIGAGAVIGANSVVTRDVPAMTIVAGVPARVIRRRERDEPVPAETCASN